MLALPGEVQPDPNDAVAFFESCGDRRDPAERQQVWSESQASETDIEVDCHGVSIVEIAKTAGKFTYVQNSTFNRRITAASEIEISGPVRGHPLMVTKFSPTPWGTLLTGEENWVGYYFRAAGDPAQRTAKGNTALVRYGSNATATAAAASRYAWETSGPDDKYARWNTSVAGVSTDGSDDYRHEVNGQGYVTEIDPYNATSVVKKRTALGRMAHESAAFSKPVVGKPLAVYMGDDARNEYIYKFVSTQNWVAADATAADRVAVGDKYLDAGKLYVAKFNADGTGEWLELSITTPAVQHCDLVLIEGFKTGGFPKLEVWRAEVGKPTLWPDWPGIVAIASDDPLPSAAAMRINLAHTAAIAAFVMSNATER